MDGALLHPKPLGKVMLDKLVVNHRKAHLISKGCSDILTERPHLTCHCDHSHGYLLSVPGGAGAQSSLACACLSPGLVPRTLPAAIGPLSERKLSPGCAPRTAASAGGERLDGGRRGRCSPRNGVALDVAPSRSER